MKKQTVIIIVAIVAIVLTALAVNIYALFAILVFIPIFIYARKHDQDAQQLIPLLTLDEAEARYGKPDRSIVVDPTRANEAAGCILLFKEPGVLLVGGEPVSTADIVDISTVNTATPYTVGPYQIVLTTRKPGRTYIRMEAGMDATWAREAATQLIDLLAKN